MANKKCENCKKKYNPKKDTWSAGYGCDYYCSLKCCQEAYKKQFELLDIEFDGKYPDCPCY